MIANLDPQPQLIQRRSPNLTLHCGASHVDLDEVREVSTPRSTDTSAKNQREKYEYPPENSPPLLPREVRAAILDRTRHLPRLRIWAKLNKGKNDHANHQ